MNMTDKQQYLNRYNTRLDKFGYDIKSLGWGGDKKRQLLRFQIALELQNFLADKTIQSVLDVGCGFGDMGAMIIGGVQENRFFPI